MLRILLVEDSPSDAALIEAALSGRDGQLEITHVEQMGEAEDYLLRAAPVDCILLDLGLPDCMGLATVQRANRVAPHVPIIVLTGLDDEAKAIDVLRKGAQDYQLKGEITPRTLMRAIHHAIERKQTEEALRESEERLQSIAMNLPDHAVIQDKDLRYTFVVHPQLGLTVEDHIGRTDHEILGPTKEAEMLTKIKKRVIESGKTEKVFLPIVNKNGETEYFDGSYVPKFDDKGNVNGLIGYFRNITTQKRAEEALPNSEERLNFALETGGTGAWDLDLVDHTAHRSLLHDQIFGYNDAIPAWTYEMFLEHVLPEDREDVDRRFQQAVESGGDWSLECRIRRADGEVRWIWTAGRHRRDASGNARRMTGIVQDITDRKRAEARLTADLAALTRMHALSGRLLEASGLQPLLQEVMDAAVAIVGAERGTLQLIENDSLECRLPTHASIAGGHPRSCACNGEILMLGLSPHRCPTSSLSWTSLWQPRIGPRYVGNRSNAANEWSCLTWKIARCLPVLLRSRCCAKPACERCSRRRW